MLRGLRARTKHEIDTLIKKEPFLKSNILMEPNYSTTGKGHSLDYKGHTIYYENGIYWLAVNPTKKYLQLNQAKAEVDLVTDALNENIVNIRDFMKPNQKSKIA